VNNIDAFLDLIAAYYYDTDTGSVDVQVGATTIHNVTLHDLTTSIGASTIDNALNAVTPDIEEGT